MSIVITGNPGVGKHSITKELTKKTNYDVFDINQIALESKYSKKFDDSIDVDVKKLGNYLKKKINKNSLLVGHLAPYVLSKNQVKKAIVLRKSPYSLIPIYKKRKYSKKKIIENLDSEILGIIAYDSIIKFGSKKTFQIDTTGKSIASIVKKIQSIIDGKSHKEKIDWLTMINKKNDLRKFFSY